MPLGDRFGIGIEYYGGHFDNNVGTSFDSGNLLETHPMNSGANINIGYSILDYISIGASLGLYYTEESTKAGKEYLTDRLNSAVDLGLIISLADGNIMFDSHSTFTTQEIIYFSQPDYSVKKGIPPLVTEGTLTFSLLDKSLYLGLKSILDINIDERTGYALRAIPFVEYWLFPSFAVRGAYENSHVNQMGKFAMGHGFMFGATVSIWKFDISVNYTNRAKSLTVLPGYTIRDDKLLIGVTFYPGWMTR